MKKHGSSIRILQSVNKSRVSFNVSVIEIGLNIAMAVPSVLRNLSGGLINSTRAMAAAKIN